MMNQWLVNADGAVRTPDSYCCYGHPAYAAEDHERPSEWKPCAKQASQRVIELEMINDGLRKKVRQKVADERAKRCRAEAHAAERIADLERRLAIALKEKPTTVNRYTQTHVMVDSVSCQTDATAVTVVSTSCQTDAPVARRRRRRRQSSEKKRINAAAVVIQRWWRDCEARKRRRVTNFMRRHTRGHLKIWRQRMVPKDKYVVNMILWKLYVVAKRRNMHFRRPSRKHIFYMRNGTKPYLYGGENHAFNNVMEILCCGSDRSRKILQMCLTLLQRCYEPTATLKRLMDFSVMQWKITRRETIRNLRSGRETVVHDIFAPCMDIETHCFCCGEMR